MKKLLLSAALLAVTLVGTTPALAGHRGYSRGHRVIVRDRVVVRSARPRLAFGFGFGVPGAFYGAYYRPAPCAYGPYPYAVGPVYGPPPVWVPGHYVWDGGARLYIEGHWGGYGHHAVYEGY